MAAISRAAMTSAAVAVHGQGPIVGVGRLQCGSAEWIVHRSRGGWVDHVRDFYAHRGGDPDAEPDRD